MADKIEQATQNMIKNLEQMTGKTLAEWISIVNASGVEKVKERINFLKEAHGLTYGYANLIALMAKDQAEQASGETPEDPIEALYSGDKAGLRPVYDRILHAVQQYGADVVESPRRTYVSLRRERQFAIVQPSSKTRVDVGLVLKDRAPAGRLEAAGSWNSMCTHRVRLAAPEDVDGELLGWLREAYDAA